MVRSSGPLHAKQLGVYLSGLSKRKPEYLPQVAARKKERLGAARRSNVLEAPRYADRRARLEKDKPDYSKYSFEKLYGDGMAQKMAAMGASIPPPPGEQSGYTASEQQHISDTGSWPEGEAERAEAEDERRRNTGRPSVAPPQDFSTYIPSVKPVHLSRTPSFIQSNRGQELEQFKEIERRQREAPEATSSFKADNSRKKAMRKSSATKQPPATSRSVDDLVKGLASESLAKVITEGSAEPVRQKSLSLVARNAVLNMNLVDKDQDLKCLSPWNGMVMESDAVEVLENLSNAKRATRFFHWAEKQYNFQHSVFTYNAYLNTLVKSDDPAQAIIAFKAMLKSGCLPDKYTYGIVIRGLCLSGQMTEALKVAKDMETKRIGPSSLVANFIIAGLCRAGMVDEAFTYFSNLDDRCSADVISYNLLIHGLCKTEQVDRAVGLFGTMLAQDLKPSMITYNSVLYGLCRARRLKQAVSLFSEMLDGSRGEDIVPDVFTYNTLIDGLCKANELSRARSVLQKMIRSDIPPSVVTYNTLIDGLVRAGKLEEAEEVFRRMLEKEIQPTVVTYTSRINGYCKSKQLDKAEELFQEMPSKLCAPNVYTYTALIGGYCEAGKAEEGVRLLRQMNIKGLQPNVITYTTIVNALCKAGDTDQACLIFKEMLKRKLFRPDAFAFNTIIQGLCRNNKFVEAHAFFKKMVGEYKLKPDAILRRTLATSLDVAESEL